MDEQNVTNQDFPLSFNSYAAFDATNLKALMQQRLVDGGVFTDQIFEGSNFNSLLDVIAYSYHVLLFYLNRTSNESSFTTAQLYENINKIVKLLNYNPIGIQTSMLSFSAAATNNMPIGIYTIPKYSYFVINDITYCFPEDTTFVKTVTGTEALIDLNENFLLYQGRFVEYPIYVATGENFEEFNIVSVNASGENDLIDHNNIHVYVKSGNEIWKQYKPVNTLYLENPLSESYEIRLNENLRYNIKFGDGITGKKLKKGDFIAVYFLKSDGISGEVGPNAINNSGLFLYNTKLYSNIMTNLRPEGIKMINSDEAVEFVIINTVPSSKFTYQETSSNIKNNARNTYKTQYRLITNSDFENYIKKNFSQFIQDVKVVNNEAYMSQHLNYLKDLGLSEPNLNSRILFNQVNFASSCSFNNVYIYCIPKIPQNENTNFNKFLNLGLKTKIKEDISRIKILTSESVFEDPVYMAVGLGVSTAEEISRKRLDPSIISDTRLVIKKNPQSFTSDNLIKENILNLFRKYFEDQKLGKKIDLEYLNGSIFKINGVESFYTERTINNQNVTINGLSLMVYNPIYSAPEEDIQIITQSLALPYFKASYYDNFDVLSNNIIIE
jgi:hypothetical protein